MASDDNDLDLSALEDAVAELGLDVEDSDDASGPATKVPDAGPAPLDVDLETGASRNPGLDLTELPPPPTAPRRSMPPLGEATADDLFGPLGDDDLDDSSVWDVPAAESSAPSEPSPLRDAATMSADPAAEFADDTTGLGAQEPLDRADADPAMAGVVGFTAHGGTITKAIRAKPGKKLFGR